jgi:hypothetical protein
MKLIGVCNRILRETLAGVQRRELERKGCQSWRKESGLLREMRAGWAERRVQ